MFTKHLRSRGLSRRPSTGLPGWMVILCLILIGVGLSEIARAGNPDATAKLNMMRLKSSFILKIIQHVEWPAPSSADEASTVDIAVIGDGRAMEVLTSVISKAPHPDMFSIRAAGIHDDLSDADVVLVATGKMADLEIVLKSLSDSPTLLVSDQEGFGEAGAIVNFIVQKTKRGSKLRFEINRGRAEAAGLRISAQLMKLAVNVIGGGKR